MMYTLIEVVIYIVAAVVAGACLGAALTLESLYRGGWVRETLRKQVAQDFLNGRWSDSTYTKPKVGGKLKDFDLEMLEQNMTDVSRRYWKQWK